MLRTCLISTSALLLAALACRDDATMPTAPPPAGSEDLPAFALASNSWHTRADMPSDRIDLAAQVLSNAAGQSLVYAIGGANLSLGSQSKVQTYNVATNTWSTKAPLPVPLYGSNGAAVIAGKIYISGGSTALRTYSRALYRYDPGSNAWTRKRDMPQRTSDGVSGVIQGKLYVLTSCQDEEVCDIPSDSVLFYRYDPASDRWASLPAPMVSHLGGMGAVVNGELYVTGGCLEPADALPLDVYDPVANKWTRKAPEPHPICRGAGAGVGGKLYIFGGVARDLESEPVVRTTRVYDVASNTWTTGAPLPTARWRMAARAVVLNGQTGVEVIGGDGDFAAKLDHNNLLFIP